MKKTLRIKSANSTEMYRIYCDERLNTETYKFYKVICVATHKRDYEAADVIVDCIGDKDGHVFEAKAEEVQVFKVTDKWYGSIKKAADTILESIEKYGRWV